MNLLPGGRPVSQRYGIVAQSGTRDCDNLGMQL